MAARPPNPASPVRERQLGEYLVDAVRLYRRDFYRRTGGLKLTPALARLLLCVHRRPGCRQADLAGHLEITPVTLGRMVDRLVERGYLRRAADESDRRAFRVYVDTAGEPLMLKLLQLGQLTAARATRGLSARDSAAVVRNLARICRNLSEGED